MGMSSMNHTPHALAAIAIMLTVVVIGCSGDVGTPGNQRRDGLTVSRSEHDGDGGEVGFTERDGDERGVEAGEESGTELALNESYDEIRGGARLILTYDAQGNSFSGTVDNTTNETLRQVRVEVHLSNGRELGPTTPADLGPGEAREVTLLATSKDFDGWTAHAEVGTSEHGGEEGEGEHRAEPGEGEHGSEERGEHR